MAVMEVALLGLNVPWYPGVWTDLTHDRQNTLNLGVKSAVDILSQFDLKATVTASSPVRTRGPWPFGAKATRCGSREKGSLRDWCPTQSFWGKELAVLLASEVFGSHHQGIGISSWFR